MQRYTVQVESYAINHADPAQPLFSHFIVFAASESDAVAQIQSGLLRGKSARVVAPF